MWVVAVFPSMFCTDCIYLVRTYIETIHNNLYVCEMKVKCKYDFNFGQQNVLLISAEANNSYG